MTHPAIMFFVFFLTFALLVCCWKVADVSFRTKVLLTGLYACGWLIWWKSAYFAVAAQSLLAIVLGGVTFGVNWLKRKH